MFQDLAITISKYQKMNQLISLFLCYFVPGVVMHKAKNVYVTPLLLIRRHFETNSDQSRKVNVFDESKPFLKFVS